MFDCKNLHFWRQHLVFASVWSVSVSAGIMLAFPSALNPSLQAPNGTDIRATVEQASWIASSSGISGIPSFIILPIIMQRYGRKILNIILNVFLLSGWILFILAKTTAALLSARLIHGVVIGVAIIHLVLLAEYSDPKRRGYSMVMKKIFVVTGMFLCHVLSLCMSWRQIAGISILFNILSLILTLFWPESPAYLAMRKRFVECEKSFIWLHGNKNKQELKDLIASQENEIKKQLKTRKTLKNLVNRFLMKDFQTAFFVSFLSYLLVEASGRHYFAAYLVEMMLELLGDKSIALYISVGNDVFALVGVCIAVIVVKHFKRRTLLFSFGGIATVLMFTSSAALFLKSSYPLANLDLWAVFFILLLNLVNNIGVVPIAYTIMGEIYPLDTKGLGIALSGGVLSIIFAATLKLTPILIMYTGLSGTLLINACIVAIVLSLLYFILPETKDKSLLNIELELKGEKKAEGETKPMI